jgi:2-polyprenyl-3-methyl-5-hydroxy-6-metoxy-1,4-benzoquinol methylase
MSSIGSEELSLSSMEANMFKFLNLRGRKRGGINKIDKISDSDFVELCYDFFLSRQGDFQGKKSYLEQLRKGLSRLDLIKSVVSSPEYFTLLTKQLFGEISLPDLTKLRPDNFSKEKTVEKADEVMAFSVIRPEDYDWIEEMILSEGYYERAGVWPLAIDIDKKIFAEIIVNFDPHKCLDIGCSTGAVVKLLNDNNIETDGVEISHLAIGLSYPDIKKKMLFGDILNLEFKTQYDFILGLDIFEHLNPNKLDEYLRKCHSLLEDHSFLLANIPAIGKDEIFGEIFPISLLKWDEKAQQQGLFPIIPTDDKGWPDNGHIITATTQWWQKMFETSGFRREPEIERAIHKIYDAYWNERCPGRKALFVFSKRTSPVDIKKISNRIMAAKSSYASCEF